MRFTKLILLSAIAISLSFATYSEENKEDCSEIKNIYKKIVCNTNNQTSGITSKKTFADFWKKKK
tara:strand:+ start:51 stop:245 length:195 start_codon:yes stop_codon:yes gene_type:complete